MLKLKIPFRKSVKKINEKRERKNEEGRRACRREEEKRPDIANLWCHPSRLILRMVFARKSSLLLDSHSTFERAVDAGTAKKDSLRELSQRR
jgi:hypothetical protein